MQYIVITANALPGLINLVNAQIEQGYVTAGGVSVYNGYYYQAMIKRNSTSVPLTNKGKR